MSRRTHQFGSVTVTVWYPPAPSRVETVFADGAKLVACPQDGADYSEHDVLHSYLADALGWPCSPTLYAAAHNSELDAEQRAREEGLVLAFARYMNLSIADDRLLPLTEAGLDLVGLREEAISLLR